MLRVIEPDLRIALERKDGALLKELEDDVRVCCLTLCAVPEGAFFEPFPAAAACMCGTVAFATRKRCMCFVPSSQRQRRQERAAP
jgi:hypothetical protein